MPVQVLPEVVRPVGSAESISIPPSLLISAMGQVDDAGRCVTMDLKAPGNLLYQVGVTREEMGGSHFALTQGLSGGQVPFRGENHKPVGRTPTTLRERIHWEVVNLPYPGISQYNPGLPDEVDAILRKALDKNPAQRFASTLEFNQAFEPLGGKQPSPLPKPPSTFTTRAEPAVPPRSPTPLPPEAMPLQPSAIREILKVTQDPSVISFAAGNPSPETFPAKEMSAIAADLFENHSAAALQYGISEGYGPLRDAVARMLAGYGMQAASDDVLITGGCQQALDLAVQALRLARRHALRHEVALTPAARSDGRHLTAEPGDLLQRLHGVGGV